MKRPARTHNDNRKRSVYPLGWDEKRVREVLERCKNQSDDEAVAEDEAAYEAPTETMIAVPAGLVPAVR